MYHIDLAIPVFPQDAGFTALMSYIEPRNHEQAWTQVNSALDVSPPKTETER